MVEAPRIRILYDRLKFIKGKKIKNISGPSYKKMNTNLINFKIESIWFAGKYIYISIIKKSIILIIRTHFLMYGRIIINNERNYPNLFPFLILELNDGSSLPKGSSSRTKKYRDFLQSGTILTWYLSQIKLIDPACKKIIQTNYTDCSSKIAIKESHIFAKYDISNILYNYDSHLKHVKIGAKFYKSNIYVDFLLDQFYFPGVGNIIQQEGLYRCKILPTKKVSGKYLICLLKELKSVCDKMYQSFITETKMHFIIYHKAHCQLGHKTITKYLGFRDRRVTWCPICQH